MPIIDQNTVLIDSTAPYTSTNFLPVDTGFVRAGRQDILLDFRIVEAHAGGTSLAFKLQECDTKDGTYSDVTGSEFTLALADDELEVGRPAPYGRLPNTVMKRWIKLATTVTGTFTAGKAFAALVREQDWPYADGMYIDKGNVEG